MSTDTQLVCLNWFTGRTSLLPAAAVWSKGHAFENVNKPPYIIYKPTATTNIGDIIINSQTTLIIKLYINIVTTAQGRWYSTHLEANPGWRAEGVTTNNHGKSIRTLSPPRRFRQCPSYSPYTSDSLPPG